MSTIGAFLTLSKSLYPTPNCQKCSKFAQIQRDVFILWVDLTQQIWQKSEHFWQCPKFHIFYPKFGSCQKCSDCAHILFIKSTHQKNYHTKYEQNRSIFIIRRNPGRKLRTLSKMLRFCSYLVCKNNLPKDFTTPNMSQIGEFLTIFKTLDPIILTIRKKSIPNFWYVAINRPIYLKSGPKLSGNPRNIGFIFDWNVIFQMLTVLACLGLGPNYLTRTDHHRD